MDSKVPGTDEAWSMFRRSRDAAECDSLEIPVRVVCDPRVVGVQPELSHTDFVMPDRGGGATIGVAHNGDEAVRRFEFALVASHNRTNGRLRFFGPYCHGPAGDEFIYLGWKPAGRPDDAWVWRIKLYLTSLTWDQLTAVFANHQRIEYDATGRVPHENPRIEWRFV